MVRIILAAIAGFIAWSILWVGSEQVLSSASPDWLGAHQTAFERATFNNEPFAPDSSILVLALVRLIIVSIISGFLTAVIAGENRRSTLILGILLLLFGGYVTFVTWSLLPIWYHLLLLVLLIPMTVLGGRLKKTG